MSQREVVLVEGARTAFGRLGGTLRELSASRLAAIGIRGLVAKTRITDKTMVDCVFLGSATHCSEAYNPARWASIEAGLDVGTTASYIEMQVRLGHRCHQPRGLEDPGRCGGCDYRRRYGILQPDSGPFLHVWKNRTS